MKFVQIRFRPTRMKSSQHLMWRTRCWSDGNRSRSSAPASAVRRERAGRASCQRCGAPRPFLLGPDPLDDRDRRGALGSAAPLGRPVDHSRHAVHQRGRRLLAGVQGRQRHRALEAAAGAESARQARRRLERRRGAAHRARRRRPGRPRQHRSGRHEAGRGRLSQRRPVGADRRVAARRQEGRRRGLFRLDRQAGRDDRPRHRDRHEHLFRQDRASRRAGEDGVAFPARGAENRQLPHSDDDRPGAR